MKTLVRFLITAVAVCLLTLQMTVADGPPVQWEKTFGGSSHYYGNSVQQTTDGGYIIAGSTAPYGAGSSDVYLIKTDSAGNKTWQKTFGGSDHDNGWSVQQTTDGGYIITGSTASYGAGSSDVYLIKTDSAGNKTWQKTFGGSDHDNGWSIQQTSDGGYIIAGYTNASYYGADDGDVYLIKTDSAGNRTWQKTFGGIHRDDGRSVEQTTDGGYIIAGGTASYGTGREDVYLIKADSGGNMLWQKTFGGSSHDWGHSVQQTSDGGYIIAGWTSSFGAGDNDVYLIKTESAGNILWQKTFGFEEFDCDSDYGLSVQQTTDGGYIIAGVTYSNCTGPGDPDVYVVKTDTNGNMLWEKTFGGSGDDWGRSVQQTSDGGYIIAGRTESYGAGANEVYLIKVGRDPYLPTTVQVTTSVSYEPTKSQLTISATGYDRATASFVTEGNASYYIRAIARYGSLTYDGSLWTATVDLSAKPPEPGQYTITVTISNGSASCVFNVVGNNGRIKGVVQDVNDTPLAGIRLNLYNYNGYFSPEPNPMNTCLTEPNGFYSFDDLVLGWYVVDVNDPGYLPQHQACMIDPNAEVTVNFVLTPYRTLAQLISSMRSLRGYTEQAMAHDANLMSKISYQAVSDLSADFDANDVISFIGDVLSGTAGALKSIGNEISRQQMELVLQKVFLRKTLKAIAKKSIDVAIQDSVQDLLPEDMDSWVRWSEDDLKDVNVWTESYNWLLDAESDFEANAPNNVVADDFDFEQANRVISSQLYQLWCQVNDDAPVCLMPLADPAEGFLALSMPMGYQVWLMDHASISFFGGLQKVATTIQLGAGTVAVVTTATGIGAPVGAVAGTVCAGATKVKAISGAAETVMKFHGALTYATNAKGWAQDIAALPLSYTKTKTFLEKEAASPYYLSGDHRFWAEANFDLNISEDSIFNTLLPLAFNNATVVFKNTSDVSATIRLVPTGWWDYHLPGDNPYIGGMFGGVTEIKLATTIGAPVSVELPPDGNETVSIPYLGFLIDPINMFSPHWFQIDVYAGPFFVKSVAQPYLVCPGVELESSVLVANCEKDGQMQVMAGNDYGSMTPVITTLASGVVDINTPVIEQQHAVDSNSWSVCFKLLCDKGAYIALQVYDANGNCVGYDISKGGILNQFIATYTGNGSGNQDVDIPGAAGKTYKVKAVLEGASTAGPFNVQLFAFETPTRPAVLAAMPGSIRISTQPINTVELGITVGEAGHQKPLHGLSVTLSELKDANGSATLPIIGPSVYDINDMPAGSSESVSFTSSVPKEVRVGDYTGEITINSSNAGSIIVPVTITNDDIAEDLTRDGIVDVNDISDFANQWLQTGQLLADIHEDGQVDFLDFVRLADKWLWQASWYSE